MNLIYDKIEEYNKIAIYTHVRPDGDCCGAAHSLKVSILSKWPKKEVIVLGDETPSYISYIGKTDQCSDEFIKESLGISVDTATLERVFDQRFIMSKFTIKFDHHINVSNFADLNYTKISSSVCENVAEFLYHKNLPISKEVAIPLLTGMITDNGRFMYRGVNSFTFMITSKILNDAQEIDLFDDIYTKIYERSTDNLLFLSWYLKNIKFSKGFCYQLVTKKIMKKYKVKKEDSPIWLSNLANFKDIDIWFQITDYDTYYRCELRSKKYPVNEVAQKFGGGGHKNASGIKFSDIKKVREFISYLENLNLN